MRNALVSLLSASLATISLSAAGCSPALRDGWYTCSAPSECPSGFTCAGGRCHRGTGTDCRIDLHCDDGDACTLDVCEGGLCAHEPQAAACDDGDFCNGPDTCTDGECTNVGPPPCPGVCDASGCVDCGQMGLACCAGSTCSTGACVSGTCAACGGIGQPCCPTGTDCVSSETTCASGSCVACGGLGQPCCGGGRCALGTLCNGNTCAAPPGCIGVVCPGGMTCVGGACTACGLLGQPCCGDTCGTGASCNLGTMTCEERTCGGPGEACCSTTPACETSTLECGGGLTCQPCGVGVGSPCCAGSCGAPDLVCDATAVSCAHCGLDGERCCGAAGAGTCSGASGLCIAGFCRDACGGSGEPCCNPAMRCAGGACLGGTCP